MSLPPFEVPSKSKYTEPPNPSWAFGQSPDELSQGKEWMEGEKEGWKVVDTATEDPGKLYALMISGIVPRPIAFVSSICDDGIENLAPFSWFNMVSHNPPTISVCCATGASGLKDTVNNIKANKGFTVNIISEPWAESANVCSIDAPEEVNEWLISGLTKEKSIHVKPARVKESAFSMECELLQTVDITNPSTGKVTTTMILGHVNYVHVRNDMLTERGIVDPLKFRPIARMGEIAYARLGDLFRLPRHVWKQEEPNIPERLKRSEALPN